MSDSWVDQIKRRHPIHWRWMLVKNWFQRTWDWVLDRPYWFPDGKDDLTLKHLRSKRPHDGPDEDS